MEPTDVRNFICRTSTKYAKRKDIGTRAERFSYREGAATNSADLIFNFKLTINLKLVREREHCVSHVDSYYYYF